LRPKTTRGGNSGNTLHPNRLLPTLPAPSLHSMKKSQAFRIIAATGIHKGDRQYQQDQVVVLTHPFFHGCVLGVVADGMGGRSGGRKASDQVILTARQLFESYSPKADDPTIFLRRIAQEAHIVIRLTALSAEQEPHSTIAAFLINPNGSCYWVHAGDSRIYHFHGPRLITRTKDHSYVQALVDKGEISEEEANDHPHSNILVGCLGADADPPLTFHQISRLQPGHVLLACSDGLWHYFSPTELAAVLDNFSPREAAEFLTEKARVRAQNVGDNLSLIIVKIEMLVEEKKQPLRLAERAAAGAFR